MNDFPTLHSKSIITQIGLGFSKNDKILQFYVEDKNYALSRRSLKSNRLAYKGPRISINANKQTRIELIYTIRQFIDSEEDKQKKCRNYPNKDFSSYEMCDEHFVKEILKYEFNNTVPFWMSNDFGNVTVPYTLQWKIIDRGRVFNPVTKKCRLCLKEKWHIMFNTEAC